MPASGYQFEQPDLSQYGRVAVLMGGRAAEREVSLLSGTAVLDALQQAGVDAFAIDLYGEQGDQNIIKQLTHGPVDQVVNMLHGGEGENGTLASVLEALEIPYTGCGVAASALAMDKVRCKYLWRGMGLPTAPFALLKADTDWAQIIEELGLPLMVKPGNDGSSLGMTKVTKPEQLPAAYETAAKLGTAVLAEAWLSGDEYTVTILKGQALPVIRLATAREFYDYQAKYIDDDTQYCIPSGLAAEQESALQTLARSAFDSLGCSGWGRVDAMQNDRGEMQLLEINTVPGMTSHSLVPMAAQAAGLDFTALVLQILSTCAEDRRA